MPILLFIIRLLSLSGCYLCPVIIVDPVIITDSAVIADSRGYRL